MNDKSPMDATTGPLTSLKDAHAFLTAPGQRFETVETLVRGVPTRVWKHVPTAAIEVFLRACAFGRREFLVHENERVSYDAFARATLKVAQLLTENGVRKGDRVALVMRNLPEWPVIFMGILISGAIAVPLNAWWSASELQFAIDDCGARFVFADAERLALLEDLPAFVERVFVVRAVNPPSTVTILEDVLGVPEQWPMLPMGEIPNVSLLPDDDATIFYTSGTTGSPKGALGTHRALTTNIFAMPFVQARNELRWKHIPRDPHGQRVTLIAVPFFHVIGSVSILVPNLVIGGKLVLMRKFDAERACALIAHERVTVTGGVPAVALALLDHAQTHNLSPLELVTYGGAPSPHALAGRIVEELGAMPGQGWGMTETSATCTSHSGHDFLARPASCGPALPVCDLKVMDGERQAPPGMPGELWARGPNIVKGYWNRPLETAEKFRDGWLRTGDLAMLDEEGFCTILDRAQDMLIRGGENIYCIEVEHVLMQHPAVMDAALIGLPHPILGEVPAAMVQSRPGMDVSVAELQNFVRDRLARFKVPVEVKISGATLPRNAGGKVSKQDLRKAFEK